MRDYQEHNAKDIRDLTIYTKTIPAHPAAFADFPAAIHPDIRTYLTSHNIPRLYTHQAEMFDKAQSGENVVITTSTASGKTLSFLIPKLVEEDRRLFFVGITRAENDLELSWYTNPGERGVIGEPSRYLRMIPEQLLDYGNTGKQESVRSGAGTDGAGRKSDLRQLRRQVQDQIRLKREAAQKPEVVRVRHRKYGEGILVSEDEMMMEAKFEGYGRKQFLKAFGEIEILHS